jgi:hypothetical protein
MTGDPLPVRVAAEKQKPTLIATVSPDRIDECPQDREKNVPSVCGCGILVDSNSDSDNVGFLECRDECPTIIDKTVPSSVSPWSPTINLLGLIVR